MRSRRLVVFLVLVLVGLCLASFATGFVASQYFAFQRLSLGRLQLAASRDTSDVLAGEEPLSKFEVIQILWSVWDTIEKKYVEPIDDQRPLLYGALRGLINALGQSHHDAYSRFMEPAEFSDFSASKEGQFEGIGAFIGQRTDPKTGEESLVIVEPIPGTPAAAAGLKAMDRIVKIDDKPTKGMTTEMAANLIRGKPGTKVRLTIFREGVSFPFEVEVTRQKVDFPVIEHRMVAPGIGYVLIRTFSDNTADKLDQALDDLEKQDMRALIIDLRNNPGGLLSSAVQVTSRFIKESPLIWVSERGSEPEPIKPVKSVYRAKQYPMAVLTNENTASGAEIMAAALQDYGLATVVGVKTFGKGMVQTVFPLPDRSAIALTTGRYLTPKKRDINKEKVVPDLIVEPAPYAEELKTIAQAPSPEVAERLLEAVTALGKGEDRLSRLSPAERKELTSIMVHALAPFTVDWQVSKEERDAKDQQLKAAIKVLRDKLESGAATSPTG